MTVIVDAAARSAAINPLASVCVSAPAGSGKTELLIQRYLCLLSRVRRPEQVLAITFTRKAAAEMRDRVMDALQAARAKEPCFSPHQRVTRALADLVLASDEQGEWNLLRDISRFNIKTIDSFCAGLTRQMPVLSQFGGQASVQDDVTPLYIEAVHELYALIDEDNPVAADLAALMLHFDNNWDHLRTLLVSMLARRDQWRSYVGVHHAPQESEAYLIATVSALVTEALGEAAQLLRPHEKQLLALLQFAALNRSESAPAKFPGITAGDLEAWNSIVSFLLTRSGEWRKTITKREGFPAGAGEPRERKKQWTDLQNQLQEIDGLHTRLLTIRSLPVVDADSVSWQLVVHLSRLLPTLAAQLLLVFQKHGIVDHSQVAQSALLSLGDDDAPTELALRLDYQIEHILVDEFQDTAIIQYELLHKLTRGWGEYNNQSPQAPRTLMIVGDGMQSVYGFRGANVGLFLKARQEGFNGVRLQYVALRCNFRSNEDVVNWVNQTFARAFPVQDNTGRLQVSYSPATATRPAGLTPAVAIHAFEGDGARAQEDAFICAQIAENIALGEGSIAVLGRSRAHLQLIISRLKQANISYYAPDLDSLAKSPLVADLMTLCRALANDADRLAWMALLRAPWCGLQLADLLCVARFGEAPPYSSVWSSLQLSQLHQMLTDDGRARLLQILPALHLAREKRDRLGLRVWIEQVWVGLAGPACAPGRDSLLDAENFLQLLEQADAEGTGLDLDWLSLQLQRRFMSAGDPGSRVHLMTLHKAKGLEFDRVIVAQLDRVPRGDGRELLVWDEHSNALGERSFLLAADDHSAAATPTLYNYLRAQRQEKMLLEGTRLLYVGCTRAINHLLLTATIKIDIDTTLPREPARRSLLSSIWQIFKQQMTVHASYDAREMSNTGRPAALLTRVQHRVPAQEVAAATLSPGAVAMRPQNLMERSIGTVVHLALEELSRRPVLPEEPSDRDQQRWRMALQREGLWGENLAAAQREVLSSVRQSLRADGAGRWVLATEHIDARSEWALTLVDAQGRIRDIIIDRTFVDSATGERWVIDYKNTCPAPDEPMAAFLKRQSDTYLDQLQCYRDAVRHLGQEPLRCALFFTALGQLHAIPDLDLPAATTGPNSCHS